MCGWFLNLGRFVEKFHLAREKNLFLLVYRSAPRKNSVMGSMLFSCVPYKPCLNACMPNSYFTYISHATCPTVHLPRLNLNLSGRKNYHYQRAAVSSLVVHKRLWTTNELTAAVAKYRQIPTKTSGIPTRIPSEREPLSSIWRLQPGRNFLST